MGKGENWKSIFYTQIFGGIMDMHIHEGNDKEEFPLTNFIKDLKNYEEPICDPKDYVKIKEGIEDPVPDPIEKRLRTVAYSSGGEIREESKKEGRGWFLRFVGWSLDKLIPSRKWKREKQAEEKKEEVQEKRFNVFRNEQNEMEDEDGGIWGIVVSKKFGDAPGAEDYQWRRVR